MKYSGCAHIYGAFSATSNLTGIIQPVDRICELMHKYNGYAFIDYASLAPYHPINMNTSVTAYKDAIFISPHKFIGGPGASGVLAMKR